MKVWFASVALVMVGILLVGCGGGTKTVTQTTESGSTPEAPVVSEEEGGQESLRGEESEAANIPTPAEVGNAIVDDIEERYGDGFEGGECENFLPGAGGPPVYICEIKMGGGYHTIEATIHPDGSFEWIEQGGEAAGNYEGDELSVNE